MRAKKKAPAKKTAKPQPKKAALQIPSELACPELDALSERHRLFVHAFFGDARGNAEKAARIAGFKKHGQSKRLIARPDVEAAIAAIRRKADAEKVMGAVELQELLTRVIRGQEMAEVVRGNPPEVMQTSVPWAMRLVAARDLAKLMGYRAPEKKKVEIEHTHRVYFPLVQPPEELEWDGPLLGDGDADAALERELDAVEGELVGPRTH